MFVNECQISPQISQLAYLWNMTTNMLYHSLYLFIPSSSARSVWHTKSATASLIVKVTYHWRPTSCFSQPYNYHISLSINWQGRSPAGSYASGPTHRMVGFVPASVVTMHCHRLSLCSWPNKLKVFGEQCILRIVGVCMDDNETACNLQRSWECINDIFIPKHAAVDRRNGQ